MQETRRQETGLYFLEIRFRIFLVASSESLVESPNYFRFLHLLPNPLGFFLLTFISTNLKLEAIQHFRF